MAAISTCLWAHVRPGTVIVHSGPVYGGTTQVTGLLGGEISLGLESVNVALPFARAGKLKIIALTGGERISLAPEIATGEQHEARVVIEGLDLGEGGV